MANFVSVLVNVQLAKLHQAITTWISTETLGENNHTKTYQVAYQMVRWVPGMHCAPTQHCTQTINFANYIPFTPCSNA